MASMRVPPSRGLVCLRYVTIYRYTSPVKVRLNGGHDLRPGPRPLRADALPPLWPQRPQAARDVALALAELRRGAPPRALPRDRAPRVRPRHHALRPGEQLRAALRVRRARVRRGHGPRPAAASRRAGHLDEGRLRHVARPLRRLGLAQVPAREPRPEPRAH